VTSPARRSWEPALVLIAPAAAFLVLCLVVPVALLFGASLRPVDSYGNMAAGVTLAQYRAVLSDPYFADAFGKTVLLALEVTGLCVVLGYPAAYALATTRSRLMRVLLYTIVLSPLLTSVVVRTYGWIVVFANDGLLNQLLRAAGLVSAPLRLLYSFPAVVVAVTQVLLPYMIIPLVTSLASIDPALKKASFSLGAERVATFARVTLPLSVPGLAAGTLFVFASAMGIYATPLLIGSSMQPIVALRIYEQVLRLFDFPMGAALSYVLLLVTLALCLGLVLLFGRWERKLFGHAR
jgi:putative spermidine/putrescine transport system permease protein